MPKDFRMTEVIETAIPAVKIIKPTRIGDSRGFFSEVYSSRVLAGRGIDTLFVQDNHSRSSDAGTIRGLHFQTGANAQTKLIRVVRGRILDIAVDIRRSSPTYGHHLAVELSAENWAQLLVPIGFAHGFCTLEPDVEVIYKVSAYYDAENDRGLAFDDPALGIQWPVDPAAAILSAKDRAHPTLAALPAYFD